MSQRTTAPLVFTVMDHAVFGQSPNPALALALYLYRAESPSARDVLSHILDDDLFRIRVGNDEYSVCRQDLRGSLDDDDEMLRQ